MLFRSGEIFNLSKTILLLIALYLIFKRDHITESNNNNSKAYFENFEVGYGLESTDAARRGMRR